MPEPPEGEIRLGVDPDVVNVEAVLGTLAGLPAAVARSVVLVLEPRSSTLSLAEVREWAARVGGWARGAGVSGSVLVGRLALRELPMFAEAFAVGADGDLSRAVFPEFAVAFRFVGPGRPAPQSGLTPLNLVRHRDRFGFFGGGYLLDDPDWVASQRPEGLFIYRAGLAEAGALPARNPGQAVGTVRVFISTGAPGTVEALVPHEVSSFLAPLLTTLPDWVEREGFVDGQHATGVSTAPTTSHGSLPTPTPTATAIPAPTATVVPVQGTAGIPGVVVPAEAARLLGGEEPFIVDTRMSGDLAAVVRVITSIAGWDSGRPILLLDNNAGLARPGVDALAAQVAIQLSQQGNRRTVVAALGVVTRLEDGRLVVRPDDGADPRLWVAFDHTGWPTPAPATEAVTRGWLLNQLRPEQPNAGLGGAGSRAVDAVIGPDLFGLRVAPPTPSFLDGYDFSELDPTRMVAFFDRMSLVGPPAAPTVPMRPRAKRERVPDSRVEPTAEQLSPAALASDPATVTVAELTGGRRWASVPVPGHPDTTLPPALTYPHLIHSIWLGGPLRGTGKMGDFRAAVAGWAGANRAWGRMVLWTDVSRAEMEQARSSLPARTGPDRWAQVRDMLLWAQDNGVRLVHVNEVFSAQAPMVLQEFFNLELARQLGHGYAAASDILRFELMWRFGGIYADGDTTISGLFAGLLNQVATMPAGWAAQDRGGTVNNGLFVFPPGHPIAHLALSLIRANYAKTQRWLYRDQWVNIDATPARFAGLDTAGWGAEKKSIVLRHEVIILTGPAVLRALALILFGRPDPRALPTVSGTSGGAQSWMGDPSLGRGRWPWRTSPLASTTAAPGPDETLALVQRIVATLAFDLGHRDGDLRLTAVQDVVRRHPDPGMIWEVVLRHIATDPGLAGQVRWVTLLGRYPDGDRELVLPPAARAVLTMGTGAAHWWLGELSRPASMLPPNATTPAEPASPGTATSTATGTVTGPAPVMPEFAGSAVPGAGAQKTYAALTAELRALLRNRATVRGPSRVEVVEFAGTLGGLLDPLHGDWAAKGRVVQLYREAYGIDPGEEVIEPNAVAAVRAIFDTGPYGTDRFDRETAGIAQALDATTGRDVPGIELTVLSNAGDVRTLGAARAGKGAGRGWDPGHTWMEVRLASGERFALHFDPVPRRHQTPVVSVGAVRLRESKYARHEQTVQHRVLISLDQLAPAYARMRGYTADTYQLLAHNCAVFVADVFEVATGRRLDPGLRPDPATLVHSIRAANLETGELVVTRGTRNSTHVWVGLAPLAGLAQNLPLSQDGVVVVHGHGVGGGLSRIYAQRLDAKLAELRAAHEEEIEAARVAAVEGVAGPVAAEEGVAGPAAAPLMTALLLACSQNTAHTFAADHTMATWATAEPVHIAGNDAVYFGKAVVVGKRLLPTFGPATLTLHLPPDANPMPVPLTAPITPLSPTDAIRHPGPWHKRDGGRYMAVDPPRAPILTAGQLLASAVGGVPEVRHGNAMSSGRGSAARIPTAVPGSGSWNSDGTGALFGPGAGSAYVSDMDGSGGGLTLSTGGRANLGIGMAPAWTLEEFTEAYLAKEVRGANGEPVVWVRGLSEATEQELARVRRAFVLPGHRGVHLHSTGDVRFAGRVLVEGRELPGSVFGAWLRAQNLVDRPLFVTGCAAARGDDSFAWQVHAETGLDVEASPEIVWFNEESEHVLTARFALQPDGTPGLTRGGRAEPALDGVGGSSVSFVRFSGGNPRPVRTQAMYPAADRASLSPNWVPRAGSSTLTQPDHASVPGSLVVAGPPGSQGGPGVMAVATRLDILRNGTAVPQEARSRGWKSWWFVGLLGWLAAAVVGCGAGRIAWAGPGHVGW